MNMLLFIDMLLRGFIGVVILTVILSIPFLLIFLVAALIGWLW
jgi:hypothetical protein